MIKSIKNHLTKNVVPPVENFDYFISDITKVLEVLKWDFLCVDWDYRKASRIIFPIIVSFVYVFVFEPIYFVYYQAVPGLILESLLMWFGIELFLLKFIMTVRNRHKIIELLGQIRTEFWDFDENNWLKKTTMVKGSRKMKFYVRAYIGLFIFTAMACAIRPILSIIFLSTFESPFLVPMPGSSTLDFSSTD